MYNIYTFSYHLPHALPQKVTIFPRVIYKHIQVLQTSQDSIFTVFFKVSQPNFCSFTNLKMSYQAVVNDLICFSCLDQILVFGANCRLTAGSNKPVELNSPAKCGDGQSFGLFIREFPQW